MIASRLFFYFILFLVPSFLFAEENYCNYVSNYAEQSLRNHLYAKETYNLQNKRLQKVLLKLDTIKFGNFYKKELKETLKKAYKIEAKEDLNETAESIVKFKKLVAHSCSINLKRLLASELKTQNQCNIYSIDLDVKNACLGNANYLNDGKYALMSKYIIQNQCDYIKGIDNTQISYLCKNPSSSSCSVLYNAYNENVVQSCIKCNGSKKWLAMFVASLKNETIKITVYLL